MITKAEIEKYFVQEKQESLLFLVLGLIAIALALAFYFYWKTEFHKGAAIPLIVIGLIQAIVGYSVYSRSDNQRISNVYAMDMDPGKLKSDELPRMKKVMQNFVIYRWTEIVLLVVGIILIFLYRSNIDKSFWFGLGITLAIQSAIMFSADLVAEKRGARYSNGLEEYLNKSK
ncbi:MAG: hypothetical protein C5B52_11100 [Bacteroidetes bacterium]|nr:MAG: hypothetical protein C5B52_11100 [Bacteroidota bacterium]